MVYSEVVNIGGNMVKHLWYYPPSGGMINVYRLGRRSWSSLEDARRSLIGVTWRYNGRGE